MAKKYIEAFVEDVKDILQKEDINYESHLLPYGYNIEKHNELFNGFFPKLVFSVELIYIFDDRVMEYTVLSDGEEIERTIDYTKGNLCVPFYFVCIISDNPDVNAKMEDLLSDNYSQDKKLIVRQGEEDISISIKKDDDYSVARKMHSRFQNNYYSTKMCISSQNVGMVINNEYHPAKIAFDPFMQYDLLFRYVSYFYLSEYYYDKLPYQIIEKDDNYIPSEEEAYYNECYLKTLQMAEELLKKTEILDKEHSDPGVAMYILDLIGEDNNVETVGDALKEFDLNKDNNLHEIQEWHKETERERRNKINEIKESERKEQRKKERDALYKEALDSVGDPEANRYLDYIVSVIKSDVGENVHVYGGSSFMEYFKDVSDNSVVYPSIIVIPVCDFSSNTYSNTNYNTTSYRLYTRSGGVEEYPFDYVNSFPWIFNVIIRILYDENSSDSAESIKDELIKKYNQGCDLFVLVPGSVDTYSKIGLKCKENYDKNVKSKWISIYSYSYETVYYSYYYNDYNLKANSRLQLSLLQMAYFYQIASREIESSINNMSDYIRCFNGLNAGMFDGKDYKILKGLYNNGCYISREQFNKGLYKHFRFCPELYDWTANGMTCKEITDNLKKKIELYNGLFTKICNDLKIPDRFYFENHHFRDGWDIDNYIKLMKQKNFQLLDDEFYISYEERERRRLKELQEEIEARRQYYAEHPEEEYDGGHGILSELLGRSFEKSNIKRNSGKTGKQDLIGQAGCAKNHGGSCSSCNIRRGCSRYWI